MVKAIPIFEFAFAAYAATASRGAARRDAPRRPLFMQTWQAVGPRGDLLVKVELCVDECGAALASGGGKSAPASQRKEIWLGDIAETARGFSGAVRMAQTPLTHVRVGQRIGFDPTHILDWTISFDSSASRDGGELCDTTRS